MNAGVRVASFVCFLAVFLVGCSSGQKSAGIEPPVAKATLVYPVKEVQKPPQVAQAPRAESVYFETGKSQISPQTAAALKKEAEWLKQNPKANGNHG